MKPAATLVLIALLVAACAAPKGPLRIGAKGFEEQAILAQVLKGVANRQGIRAQVVDCGDTYGCYRAMRNGEVDVMVEYTGTAISLAGVLETDPEAAMAQVREVYREAGLVWLEPLGFDNAYAMVVPTARAAALELDSIDDLSRLEGGLRVAAPTDYVRRPGDGLYPLLRRYGLRLSAPPILADDPGARYEALQQGRADVAIAYTTDGALAGRRLRTLSDPLDFFPAYKGAVVARAEVLERYPELAAALRQLQGRIDTGAMRSLNARVQLEGARRTQVADDLLRALGITDKTAPEGAGRAELILVRHETDRLEAEIARALRIVEEAFPEHAVQVQAVAHPAHALTDGSARLAVVGGERFFIEDRHARIPQRELGMEAVAVLGSRLVHLVRRRGDSRSVLAGRIGTVPPGSGAARVGEQILALSDKAPALRAEPDQLLAAVSQRKLDAALILATPPDAQLAEALAAHPELALGTLQGWLTPDRRKSVPYLRPARIPAGTYPGQTEAVGSVAAQVVLASPSAQPGRPSHVVGPAAALRTAGLPLSWEEVTAIVNVNTTEEMPDPLLPSPWSLRKPTEPRARRTQRAETMDTALNVAVWLFLAWLLVLLVRRKT